MNDPVLHDTIRFILEVTLRAVILLVVLRILSGKDHPFNLSRALPVAIFLALCSGLFGLWIQLWYIPIMFVVTPLVLRFVIPLPWSKSFLVTIIYIAAKAAVSYLDWTFYRN